MFRKSSKKSSSGCEDIHHSCTIRFLDETEPLTLPLQKDTKGQDLIDEVCNSLNLLEKDYFGLRFVDAEKQRHWLEPTKSAYRQLKKVHPSVLCFRVKYYPSDPLKLKEEITRYYLYLQLRRDLHHGRLLCSTDDAINLSSYIAQSEMGDFDQIDSRDYISKIKMLPKQSLKHEDKVAELHKSLKGLTPLEAEENFLRKVSALETYGVDPHPVKDPNSNQVYLGVTHLGIVTFQGNKRTHLFKWSNVVRLGFEAKHFTVTINAPEELDNSTAGKQLKQKKYMSSFKCPSPKACKHLWKCAVQQQYFFTLQSAAEAPKVKAGGTLLRRGSSYRFSGRCQAEACSESEKITRDPPSVRRSSSSSQIVPHMVRTISNLHSVSLPHDTTSDSIETDADESKSLTHSVSFGMNQSRPESLLLNASIPEENAVEIADTTYAPMSSPDEPPERSVTDNVADSSMESAPTNSGDPWSEASTMSPDLDAQIMELRQKLDEKMSAAGAENTSELPDTVRKELFPETNQMPNGGHQPSDLKSPVAPTDDRSSSPNSLGRILLATIGIILMAVITFVILFELNTSLPLVASIRRLPGIHHIRRAIYRPARKAVFRSLGW